MNIFKVFILGFQVFSTKVNLVCSNEIRVLALSTVKINLLIIC